MSHPANLKTWICLSFGWGFMLRAELQAIVAVVITRFGALSLKKKKSEWVAGHTAVWPVTSVSSWALIAAVVQMSAPSCVSSDISILIGWSCRSSVKQASGKNFSTFSTTHAHITVCTLRKCFYTTWSSLTSVTSSIPSSFFDMH